MTHIQTIDMSVQLGASLLNCEVCFVQIPDDAGGPISVTDIIRNGRSVLNLLTPTEIYDVEWEIYEGIEYE